MKKVQAPDAPHRFVRARVTDANLPKGTRVAFGWESDLPCRVCGGSELSAVHVFYTPKSRPTLAAVLAAIEAANAAYDPYRQGGSR